MTKKCTGCGQEKELTEFYRCGTGRDGVHAKCKICMSIYLKQHYLKNKQKYKDNFQKYITPEKRRQWQSDNSDKVRRYQLNWRKKNPKKYRAHRKLGLALKQGKLIKQPCEKCSNSVTEGHHDSYDKPLDVRWLCEKCHREHHKSISKS